MTFDVHTDLVGDALEVLAVPIVCTLGKYDTGFTSRERLIIQAVFILNDACDNMAEPLRFLLSHLKHLFPVDKEVLIVQGFGI